MLVRSKAPGREGQIVTDSGYPWNSKQIFPISKHMPLPAPQFIYPHKYSVLSLSIFPSAT